MNLKNTLLTSMLLAATMVSAEASNWNLCNSGDSAAWPNGSATLRASSVGFPVGSAWRTSLQWVANRWSNSPMKMDFSIQWNEPGVAMNNGQSEVWWTDTLAWPAACWIWWNGSCEIVEADMIFRNTVNYTNSTSKSNLMSYAGSARPFRTTAMHEFGHAMGLSHENGEYNIMGQDWDHIHCNGSTAVAYPGEDAIGAAMSVYGKVAGTWEDLGVVHWRRTGASGAYSTHARTRVLSTGGSELSSFTAGGEPVYEVNKGQTVRLELTYENMGKSTKSAKIGYYVSTNDYISSSDTFLAEGSINQGVGNVVTTSNTYLKIPSNLQSGTTYWLGAFIDYDNQVSEKFGSNNRTYVAIQVQ